ncbi:MAG: hypothetical protein QJR09_13575 [Micrococcus sp.]|nr:hypothetical protein [Micrococcus sp.]
MTAFTARPDMWERNESDSHNLKVIHIQREDPEGNLHPGIGVFAHKQPRILMSAENAMTLAHKLADALEGFHRRNHA